MGFQPNARRLCRRRFEAAIFMANNQGRHLTPSPIGEKREQRVSKLRFGIEFFRPQFLRLHHRQNVAVMLLDVADRGAHIAGKRMDRHP